MLREFESVAKKLQADFEETQSITHRGLKGLTRERAVVRTFLQPYLPKRYSISSGLLVDSIGQSSQQQDLVIYDEFTCPTLQDHEETKLFFAEQVFATVEVKSSLDRSAVRDILDKAASVGKLVRRTQGVVPIAPGFAINTTTVPIVGFGFGFSSTLRIEDIREEMQSSGKKMASPHWPSSILVLRDRDGNPGVMVNVDANDITNILPIPKTESRFASVKTKTQGEALLYFYLVLMHGLQVAGLATPGPDFMAYASAAGLSTPTLQMGPDALAGTRFKLEDKMVDMDETLRLRDLLKKLYSEEPMGDDEIVETFALAIQVPSIDHGFRSGTFFLLNGQICTKVSPEEVFEAISQSRQGSIDRERSKNLREFIQLVHSARASSSALFVIDTQTQTPRFFFRRPQK